MANGAIVQSDGRWAGEFELAGQRARSTFEIFPSNDSWSFLIGKPMLRALKAHHDFAKDVLTFEGSIRQLANKHDEVSKREAGIKGVGTTVTIDLKAREYALTERPTTHKTEAENVPSPIPLATTATFRRGDRRIRSVATCMRTNS